MSRVRARIGGFFGLVTTALLVAFVSVIAGPSGSAAASPPVVSDTISLGGYPMWLMVSPDGSTVFVTNIWTDVIHVIDTSTNTEVGSISTGIYPNEVALSPDGA